MLCVSNSPQRHLISKTYSLLFSDVDLEMDEKVQYWERVLDIHISTNEWRHIFTFIHKGSLNVLTQENGYKIYSKWYRTPHVIHKFSPSTSPTCWRCKSALGTLIHIWWECPIVQPFWKEVYRIIPLITTYSPNFTAAQFLLHHTSLPYHVYKNSIVLHLINAAKLCIPTHWKDTSPPSISEWLRRIKRIAEIEDLILQSLDSPSKFQDKWNCWIRFTDSTEFRNLSHHPTSD